MARGAAGDCGERLRRAIAASDCGRADSGARECDGEVVDRLGAAHVAKVDDARDAPLGADDVVVVEVEVHDGARQRGRASTGVSRLDEVLVQREEVEHQLAVVEVAVLAVHLGGGGNGERASRT